jgi:putative tricarboxylic transport membrane protein
VLCGSAAAQWKPTRDVDFVIPFGLGGGADLFTRTLIKIIQDEKLVPTNLVPINKPGGGTASGVGYVVASRHTDPHALILINPQSQITPLRVQGAMGWRELTPVMNFMLDDYLILARADSPFKSAGDAVSAAKAKTPRSYSIGSSGTADDMAIAVLESASGVKFKVVRFNGGGESLTALLGGHIDMVVGNPIELIAQIQAKTVRALGVFRPTRFAGLPDVPTLAEQGISAAPFQMWRGVAMGKDVPNEAVAYWQQVFAKVAATAAFKEYITKNYATGHVLGPAAFGTFLLEQEGLYKANLARLEK